VNSLAACKVRVLLRELPASRLRRYTFWRPKRWLDLIWLAKFFAISPGQGAETIIYLASSPDVAKATGQYFYNSVPIRPSSWAQDDRSALLLWQRSASLAGMNE